MCVYQQMTQSRKLDTVAWRVAAAGPGESAAVAWEAPTHGVVLGQFGASANRRLYVPLDSRAAEKGSRWKIVDAGGVQRLEPAGSASLLDQIVITNESGRNANPGIAVSGSPVAFKRELPSGASAQFMIRPAFYAALFANIRAGEIVKRAVIGPLALRLPPGVADATLIARVEGTHMVLALHPGRMEWVSLAEIARRVAISDFD